ncbi:hypothetical protein LRS73_35535 (plasmid) [Methylobacterium currus]|uniref:hypothetical protein n=1 Tax=Methylobacterium currus TaxID=2051553 RepID=UPI001E55178F|nr:hypothetical protein [Methylobacterium currus]UHC20446.1 hypothetical protein LRS73_35535 [Methylobacterium currus]
MSDLPFLPENWRKRAEGIAKHSLARHSLADVPPEERAHIIERVGQGMEGEGIVPPPGWRATLARQCGWEPEGDA